MSPPSTHFLTADQVARGIYAWLGQNCWFLEDRIEDADLNSEAAAQHALLLLAEGDQVAYRKLPRGVRCLAARFMMGFIAELISGSLIRNTWSLPLPVSPAEDLPAAAWAAIAHEIARSSSPPSAPH